MTAPVIRELFGVYHADGSILGELRYWSGARLGRTHCALCDITHGLVREKPAWRTCRDEFTVPFHTVHLDERSTELRETTDGHTPCVVADTEAGFVILVDRETLTSCDGSPELLVESVHTGLAAHGLTQPH